MKMSFVYWMIAIGARQHKKYQKTRFSRMGLSKPGEDLWIHGDELFLAEFPAWAIFQETLVPFLSKTIMVLSLKFYCGLVKVSLFCFWKSMCTIHYPLSCLYLYSPCQNPCPAPSSNSPLSWTCQDRSSAVRSPCPPLRSLTGTSPLFCSWTAVVTLSMWY